MVIKSSKTLVKEALSQIKTLEASKAKELLEKNKSHLIDIRDIRELWNDGAIENAIHIPRGMLEFWMDPESPYYKKEKFDDTSKSFILFCAGGMRSALAAKSLKEMGYENISHINGGFAEMKVVGFKIIDQTKK